MQPDEEYQYSMIDEDESYEVLMDLKQQIVSILSGERGLTVHFGCEEFEVLRQAANNFLGTGIDKQNIEVYLNQSSLALDFSRDDLQNFGDIFDGLGLMPRWWIYWYYC
jgi:hypothetical protein